MPVTRERPVYVKMSLYGRPKTGKTRLISTFPKPGLIIGAEDGTLSVSNVEDLDFVQVVTSGMEPPEHGSFITLEQLPDLLQSLKGSKYKTFSVDTATLFQDLVLADILGLDRLPAQKHWGMASREQYGECSLRVKTILREVLGFQGHVVITAHERDFTKPAEGEAAPKHYDLLAPSIGSALQPAVCNWLNGTVDYICQTFIRNHQETTVDSSSGVDVETVTEEVQFCLRIGPHQAFMTGFRSPLDDLPHEIVNPDFGKIYKVIRGEKV